MIGNKNGISKNDKNGIEIMFSNEVRELINLFIPSINKGEITKEITSDINPKDRFSFKYKVKMSSLDAPKQDSIALVFLSSE